jgi:hypothetical protein
MRIKQSISQYPYEWLAAILLLVYFFPIVFMSNQALYLIHDNLDSNVVWYKNLAESGLMFKKGTLDFTMGEIPRDCFPSEWSVDRLLYLFLDAQTAYSVNYILIHLLGFIGMRFLIKHYIALNSQIYNLVALAFGMLPFWVSGGITVAGLPLLVYALLNVFKNNSTKWDWLIIILFPLYSSLVFGNAFTFPFLLLFWLGGLKIGKWEFKNLHLFPFLFLFLITLLVENRLIMLLFSGFESNRLTDVASVENYMNIKGIIGSTILAFVFGHYHFHSLHVMIALISIVYIVFCLFTKKINQVKEVTMLMVVLAGFSFILLFLNNYDLKSLFGKDFPRISLRLWVWFPFLWYVIFAFVLKNMQKNGIKKLTNLFLITQVIFVMLLIYPKDYFGSRYAENIFANTILHKKSEEQSQWKTYYRVLEFEKIKREIPDIIEYKSVRIGILPEILQYNGLKTIEGYYSYYPIEKFRQVKQIDTLERAKSESNHYKHSNRNYLYYHSEKKSQPAWNWKLLKKTNVKYIVSDNTIENYNVLELIYDNELKVYKVL